MAKPRYEVHSITGYPIATTNPNGQKLGTTYRVADTEDCYREVLLVPISKGKLPHPLPVRTTNRRSMAERNCARLNAEDRADAA